MSIKEIQYKAFSLKTHIKNSQLNQPNVCQFELTFKCSLHCRHCYTDCYNQPSYLKKELSTRQVKFILGKAYNAGAIWLCLTGGDPLVRQDFLDIYTYAKDKGFIITVFTSGCSVTEEIIKYFKKMPPFVIEMTLNAVTEDLYEKISGVKGSFKKAIRGIKLILKAGLALKIKTQITKDNLEELPAIKKFVQGLGLKFLPSFDLYARLNKSLNPCNLRISPQEALSLNGNKRLPNNDCKLSSTTQNQNPNSNLFRCAIGGGDGINIDPYGNFFLCNSIRKHSFNLLSVDIEKARAKLSALVRNKRFTTNSKCRDCHLRIACRWCPGKAYLETGNQEASIPYYCQLTKAIAA